VNEPLDPAVAATLFFAGTPMLFLDEPQDPPFVCGRWQGELAIVSPIPFDDAETYFAERPVIVAADYVTPPPGVAARILFSINGVIVEGQVSTSLALNQHVDLTVSFKDAEGNAAPQPGAVTWTSSDVAVATVQGNTPDTGATVTPVAVGETTVSAASGTLTGTIQVTVTAAPATEAEVTAGTPTP
jgi:hypothetical protein